jgi:hypothetical protein
VVHGRFVEYVTDCFFALYDVDFSNLGPLEVVLIPRARERLQKAFRLDGTGQGEQRVDVVGWVVPRKIPLQYYLRGYSMAMVDMFADVHLGSQQPDAPFFKGEVQSLWPH